MDVLESMIRSLTSDEVRRFKILSNRFKTGEKKLVILFDAIRSEKFEEEDDLVRELYGKIQATTRNRYYRLRNKLLENICKSLAFYHYKSSDPIAALYDYQTGILMRMRDQNELAHYFLRKADKKASQLQQYSLLELIFEEYTHLALKGVDVDISDMIERRNEYLKELNQARDLDRALAEFRQLLLRSRFARVNGDILEHVAETRKSISAGKTLLDSLEGEIKLAAIVLEVLLDKGSAPQITHYLGEKLDEFSNYPIEKEELKLEYLQLRLAEVDATMATGEWEMAEKMIGNLEKDIPKYAGSAKRRYNFYFQLRKMDSLEWQGKSDAFQDTAIQSLSMLPESSGIREKYSVHYRLARHWFARGEWGKCLDAVTRVLKLPEYPSLKEEERFYLELLTLPCQYLIGRFQKGLLGLKNFRKTFRKTLKIRAHRRSTEFLVILQRLLEAPLEDKKVSINSAVRKYEAKCSQISVHSGELFDPQKLLIAFRDEKSYPEILRQSDQHIMDEHLGTFSEDIGSLSIK